MPRGVNDAGAASSSDSERIDEIRLASYGNALRRCRWFILATVMMACLVTIHVYLDEMSRRTPPSRA